MPSKAYRGRRFNQGRDGGWLQSSLRALPNEMEYACDKLYLSPTPQVSGTFAFATPSLRSSNVKINIPAQATIRSMNGLGSGRWSPSYKPGVNEAYLEGIVV